MDQNRDAETTLHDVIAADPREVDAYELLAMVLRDRMSISGASRRSHRQDGRAESGRPHGPVQTCPVHHPLLSREPGVDHTKRYDQRREDLKKSACAESGRCRHATVDGRRSGRRSEAGRGPPAP